MGSAARHGDSGCWQVPTRTRSSTTPPPTTSWWLVAVSEAGQVLVMTADPAIAEEGDDRLTNFEVDTVDDERFHQPRGAAPSSRGEKRPRRLLDSVGPPGQGGCAMDESIHQHKFVLDESEMPTAWYNIVPDLPSPPPPVLHPGTLAPAGPEDFAPLFPMDLILQEVSIGALRGYPWGRARRVPAMASEPALPRAPLGASSGDAGPDLLQVRGRQPGGEPQAQHGGAAGVLQREGRGSEADDRNRGRPVGVGAGDRVRALRARV